MGSRKGSVNRVKTLGQMAAAEYCPKAFKAALDVMLGKCFHHPQGLDYTRGQLVLADLARTPDDIIGNLERLKAWFGLNCCQCNPASSRVAAAKVVLEYGYGTPMSAAQVPLGDGSEKESRRQAAVDLIAPPRYEPPVRGQLTDGSVN